MSETHRYEWVTGPRLITCPQSTEFNAGKGVLEPKGPTVRLFVGQVRDRHLNIVLNWTIRSSENKVNSTMALRYFKTLWPKAKDWTASLKRRENNIPKAWTIPKPDSEFQQGLMI